jgi:hypothetical protein
MAIDPLNMPKAAGVDYSSGDVKHLAPGDELSSVSVGQSTRNLAERDNLLTEKVNQIVEVVNNKEQFVNLPTMKIILPPLTEEIITNYRIPSGFEARVLNAIVSSEPASIVKLEIFFNEGFGGSSGESLVSTLDEFTGETKFHGSGELIIKLTNIGSASAEAVASIVLTMRPTSEPFGSLIGAGTQGEQGDPGPKGDKGDKGGTGGVGPQGSPGMTWRGEHSLLTPYSINDGVSFALVDLTSAYIATAPNTGTLPNTVGGPWDLMASGVRGPSGDTFAPEFVSRTIPGTLVTTGDYTPGVATGSYLSVGTGTFPMLFNEVIMRGGSVIPVGIATAFHSRMMSFRGTATVVMPSIADGGAIDYDSDDTIVDIIPHEMTSNVGVLVTRLPPRAFLINVPGTVPAKISLSFQSTAPLA